MTPILTSAADPCAAACLADAVNSAADALEANKARRFNIFKPLPFFDRLSTGDRPCQGASGFSKAPAAPHAVTGEKSSGQALWSAKVGAPHRSSARNGTA
jgi:hypothetical protein